MALRGGCKHFRWPYSTHFSGETRVDPCTHPASFDNRELPRSSSSSELRLAEAQSVAFPNGNPENLGCAAQRESCIGKQSSTLVFAYLANVTYPTGSTTEG